MTILTKFKVSDLIGRAERGTKIRLVLPLENIDTVMTSLSIGEENYGLWRNIKLGDVDNREQTVSVFLSITKTMKTSADGKFVRSCLDFYVLSAERVTRIPKTMIDKLIGAKVGSTFRLESIKLHKEKIEKSLAVGRGGGMWSFQNGYGSDDQILFFVTVKRSLVRPGDCEWITDRFGRYLTGVYESTPEPIVTDDGR